MGIHPCEQLARRLRSTAAAPHLANPSVHARQVGCRHNVHLQQTLRLLMVRGRHAPQRHIQAVWEQEGLQGSGADEGAAAWGGKGGWVGGWAGELAERKAWRAQQGTAA